MDVLDRADLPFPAFATRVPATFPDEYGMRWPEGVGVESRVGNFKLTHYQGLQCGPGAGPMTVGGSK